jgi:hypothetical protein
MGAFRKTFINNKCIVFSILLLYFIFLTLVFTWPLITRLDTHTIGGSGDNHYFLWLIGWTKQSLFDLGQSPHRSFLLNHPYGYQLALTEIAPLQILIALPFASISNNPVLGYNIAVFSTFIFSGLFMFYWVKHLTGSYRAGLIASTAYAFLPYHFAHLLSGHLNLVAIQWFPLYFWGFLDILRCRKFTWKNVWLIAVGLSGLALSSQYYLFMTLFVSLSIFIILTIQNRFQLDWLSWKTILFAGFISLPALAVGTIPYYLVHSVGGTERPLTDVMTYSASITDYFLPFTKNPVLGKWVTGQFPRNLWGESTLYLGLPVLLLAIFALIQKEELRNKILANHFALIALIALILSFGTNLMWMEQPIILNTPVWLNTLIKKESFYLYLPGYLLYKYFPFYDIMRAWMRYGVIVMLMTVALAGIGVDILLKKQKPILRTPITIMLLILVLLDFSVTPFSLVEIKTRDVDYWLADQPLGGQVQLPLEQSFNPRTIFYTLTNQKPLIGQMNTYPTHRYFQLEPILKKFPDGPSIQRLKDENIRYVLINSALLQPESTDKEFLDGLGIEFAGDFAGIAVFLIP